MKAFWLTGTIVFLVLILIVAFGNIQAQCTYVTFLFYEVGSNIAPTFTFFGMAMIGMITGVCVAGLFNSLFAKPAEEDEEDDSATM
ncbi:MAG: hypothetical protein ABH856_00490 [Patescibacteria group bacterium]